jgi:hypothetical protein
MTRFFFVSSEKARGSKTWAQCLKDRKTDTGNAKGKNANKTNCTLICIF